MGEGNSRILQHEFSSPRGTYIWRPPKSFNDILNSALIWSVRVSAHAPSDIKVQPALSEIELYQTISGELPKCSENRIGDECSDNVLYTARFLPFTRESNILSGFKNIRDAIQKQQMGWCAGAD